MGVRLILAAFWLSVASCGDARRAPTRRSVSRALLARPASSDEPAVSALSLITLLQHAHGNLQPVHPQPQSHVRRQLVETSSALTTANTAPIRVKVDARSLDPQHAPLYSACFVVGEWFRRGLPDGQPTPPEDGLETCVRGPGETLSTLGCWGKCREGDLIATADAAKVAQVVSALADEVSSLLSVVSAEALSFQVNQGAYARALQAKGYPTPSSCAADCTTLSGVAVDEAYCTSGAGHGYDVILSLTKPPGVDGVAGTGSSCGSDESGRPLWIVLAWHSSIVGLGDDDVTDLIKQHRGFVLHEILHGLGFVNSMFNSAREPNGDRKNLLELKRVVDEDGAVDEVWFFVKGRAYELAQTYFDCHANASDSAGAAGGWQGLPLMGLPEAGRGAHMETRILRDDVMSYGFQSHVSSITLAAMEDLGYYLANYSNADCMTWGRRQGCDYVRSRCGLQTNDRSTIVENGVTGCSGDPFWGNNVDSYLSSKCGRGNDPCSGGSGSSLPQQVACPDGTSGCSRCDAQCAREPLGGRADCVAAPLSNPAGFNGDIFKGLQDGLSSIDWQAWLIPLIFLMVFLIIFSFVRKCICPQGETSRTIAYVLLFVVGALSAALCGATILIFVRRDVYADYVGWPTIITSGCVGLALLVFVITMGYALSVRQACMLQTGFWLMLVLCVVEVLLSLLVCYWVYSLGAIPGDALDSLFGNYRESIDGFLAGLLETPVAVAEGLVCKTYQQCCRDPQLDDVDLDGSTGTGTVGSGESGSGGSESGSGHVIPAVANLTHATCMGAAEHSSFNDLDATLRDPSTDNFCPYTSGAPRHMLAAPPQAVCNVISSDRKSVV